MLDGDPKKVGIFTGDGTKCLIRRARIQDIRSILVLVKEGAVEGTQPEVIPEVLPSVYIDVFRAIENDLKQELMVAELTGEVVGTFQLTFLTYLSAGGREDCQVEAVFVRRNQRGSGIGTQMMRYAINRARERNCRRVQLTTNKKRKDAHRFYQRLGFELTHEGAKLLL